MRLPIVLADRRPKKIDGFLRHGLHVAQKAHNFDVILDLYKGQEEKTVRLMVTDTFSKMFYDAVKLSCQSKKKVLLAIFHYAATDTISWPGVARSTEGMTRIIA